VVDEDRVRGKYKRGVGEGGTREVGVRGIFFLRGW